MLTLVILDQLFFCAKFLSFKNIKCDHFIHGILYLDFYI